MTYETIDWEAEIARVARAFNMWVCEDFGRFDNQHCRELFKKDRELYLPLTYDKFLLDVLFTNSGRTFSLHQLTDNDLFEGLHIGWGGEPIGETASFIHGEVFAQALIYLGLFTPAVEEKYKLVISAHQRLEWTLEYEERLK